jgi:hypothetical protein
LDLIKGIGEMRVELVVGEDCHGVNGVDRSGAGGLLIEEYGWLLLIGADLECNLGLLD